MIIVTASTVLKISNCYRSAVDDFTSSKLFEVILTGNDVRADCTE